ncbi:IclR family transcriptional regulator [Paenarthrobacter nitroguajacolicus]|uniref:IclR family transcriptional regulator n=1 Tax=Paenarthrobacter nitroguajacolicus TaxID=211146 RepID=UPI00248C040A|nr:IclR family transcriptional regulator [Paenarthrobacter nitroguajacolicus]
MTAEKTDMIGKALGLLVLLGDEPKGLGASDLARKAGLPFSTTHRLLASLTRDGFAHFEADERRYHLGLRIYLLGQRVSHAHGYTGVAQPILQRITSATRESTIMAILDGTYQLTVGKVDGPQAFRITTDPGHRGPLHSTAVGKVLVAFAEPEESEQLVEELELVPRTEHTITDRQAFREEIALVRERGYAVMNEENEVGMHAVAVPVLSPEGKATAAIATAAPVFRIRLKDLLTHVPVLQEAAIELSARLPQR